MQRKQSFIQYISIAKDSRVTYMYVFGKCVVWNGFSSDKLSVNTETCYMHMKLARIIEGAWG